MRGKVPVFNRVVRIGLTRRVRFETYRANEVSQTDRLKKHSPQTAHPEAALSPMWWRTGLNQEWGRKREEGKVKTDLSGAKSRGPHTPSKDFLTKWNEKTSAEWGDKCQMT